MRKLSITFVLVLILAACNNEPKVDYALVSGKIENKAGDVVAVRGEGFNQTINLNEDGTFADTLKIVSNGYYTLLHGRENTAIYLSAGDDLNITLDTKQFDETIKYSGVGSESNNYLAAKFLDNEKNGVNVPELYSKEEADFLAEVNKMADAKNDFLNKAEGLSDDFKALEEKSNKYEHLLNLQQYPQYHGYFAKKPDFKASDNITSLLKDITFDNNDDFKNFASYKRIVMNHYGKKIGGDDTDFPALFDELKGIKASAIKEALAKQIAYFLKPSGENNEAIYNGITELTTDDKFKESLKSKYEKIKTLAKGMPSPKFVDYENHKGGTTSLEDLKGKYVYIDVWATWCGPCKREIPFLKEVEAKYHGKNIEFVSTSIDKAADHNKWVEMVKEKELGGVQLFADKDWQSEFVKGYAIEGIPRFILVDPEGNIVSADAPRPSNPKLIELFNELKI